MPLQRALVSIPGCVLAVLLSGWTMAAETAGNEATELAKRPHPRLYLTERRMKNIEARRLANDAVWQGFVKALAEFDKTSPKSADDADVILGFRPVTYGLGYRTFKECDPARARECAEKALALADLLAMHERIVSPKTNHWWSFNTIATKGGFALVAIYDWLHDYPGFSAERKKKVREALVSMIENGRKNIKGDGGAFDEANTPQHWGLQFLFNNLAVAEAVAGEAPDNVVQGFVDFALATYERKFVDFYERGFGRGGFPACGLTFYGSKSIVQALIEERLASLPGSRGKALAERAPYTREAARCFPHLLWPSLRSMYDGGDYAYTGTPAKNGRVPGSFLAEVVVAQTAVLSGSSEAALARAVFACFEAEKGARPKHVLKSGHITNADGWYELLFLDPGEAAALDKLPLSYFASGSDLFVARSAWAADAVWFATACHKISEPDHDPVNVNHIEIVRGDDYLVAKDMGPANSDEYIRHSTVIFPGIRTWDNYPERAGVKGCLALRDAGAWAHFAGEAGAALEGGKVREFFRHTVYVRPGLLVVYDRVEGPGSEFQLFSHSAWKEDGGLWRAEVGASAIAVQTLLPKGATPSAESLKAEGISSPVRGRFYVASPAGKTEYLHVIEAGPKGFPTAAATLESTPASHALLIKTGTMTLNLSLARTGAPSGAIKISDAAGKVMADEKLEAKVEAPKP